MRKIFNSLIFVSILGFGAEHAVFAAETKEPSNPQWVALIEESLDGVGLKNQRNIKIFSNSKFYMRLHDVMDKATEIVTRAFMLEVPVAEFSFGTRGGKLYLGAEVNAMDKDGLKGRKIKKIVNMAALTAPDYFPTEFLYKNVEILDKEDSVLPLKELVGEIDASLIKGENVIVHCMEGKSRSASVVIAYLMESKNLTYDQALALVKKSRPIVKPNPGFERQLRAYERSLREPAVAPSAEEKKS